MKLLTLPAATPLAASPWSQTCIAMREADGLLRLDDGRAAQPALSCLLQPMVGDQVVVWQGPDQAYVTQILLRTAEAMAAEAVLSVAGHSRLSIRQAQLDLTASEVLKLRCLDDVELTSLRGAVRTSARDILSAASDSLVQTARHWIAQAELAALQVTGLLRAHSQQTLITAEKDMKLDAERISLG